MLLDYSSISIGDIKKQNCLAFKQLPFHKTRFSHFFSNCWHFHIFKICWWNQHDILMHGWNMIPWNFPVDGMNGSDFRGKTVGPFFFFWNSRYLPKIRYLWWKVWLLARKGPFALFKSIPLNSLKTEIVKNDSFCCLPLSHWGYIYLPKITFLTIIMKFQK